MPTATIETVTRMLEAFPQAVQDQAIEHLRVYLADLTDDLQWDTDFERTSEKLTDAADRAREQFTNGETEPFDVKRL